MLDVCREVLPEGYLLILSPGVSNDPEDPVELPLTRALHRACRSAKPSVWVDCSLLHGLSESAVDLLLAYAFMLHAQNRRLVLCHVPDDMRPCFLNLDEASRPMMVPSLIDAMHEINHHPCA